MTLGVALGDPGPCLALCLEVLQPGWKIAFKWEGDGLFSVGENPHFRVPATFPFLFLQHPSRLQSPTSCKGSVCNHPGQTPDVWLCLQLLNG